MAGPDPLFGELVVALAAGAVDAQARLSRRNGQDWLRWARDLAQFAWDADLARALAPRQMQVQSFIVTTRLRLSTDRSEDFSIRARALNLGYDLRFGNSTQTDSRMTVYVTAHPPRTQG